MASPGGFEPPLPP